MIELMATICMISTFLVAGKALTVGSDFNFLLWWKYKDKYSRWYDHRPRNEDFILEQKNTGSQNE